MTLSIPYTSLEVRWFFPGSLRKQPELINWFERESPLPSAKDLASPTWRSRQNDEPDRYLLLPGKDDMGIKWREGSFQVKGLVSRLGVQRFAGRHTGLVEHWIKWSYAGLPEAYAELFDGQHPDLRTVAVHKIRALRRIRLDSFSGKMADVVKELQTYGALVDVFDPHANAKEVSHEYGLKLIEALKEKYHGIVLAVGHQEFKDLDWDSIRGERTVVYDVKGFLDRSMVSARL